MKKYFTFLVLLLSFVLLCSCEGNGGKLKDTTTDAGTVGDNLVLVENSAIKFRLIRPDVSNDEEKKAISLISEALSDATELSAKLATDWEAEEEYEILIGETNRSASQTTRADLKSNDYAVRVIENKIVICGGNGLNTLKAAERFIADFISGKTIAEGLNIPHNLDITERSNYAVNSLLIGGESIANYNIVISNKANKIEKYAAEIIAGEIENYTGHILPIISDNKKNDFEIIVGKTNRIGAVDCLEDEYTYFTDGKAVYICGGEMTTPLSARGFIADLFNNISEHKDIDYIGNDKNTAKKSYSNPLPYQATLTNKRLVALCDQKNEMVVMIDLDGANIKAPVWTWKPSTANGFTAGGFSYGIDDAKIRYSETLGTYVLCATSSSGFMGVAEYPSGQCIWNAKESFGPHSIEYLPNGYIAVAGSGNSSYANGVIRIYKANVKLSGIYCEDKLLGAHGLVWDDRIGVLWALGDAEIVAYEISEVNGKPTMKRISELGSKMPKAGGHDLSQDATDTRYMFLSVSGGYYKFDKLYGAYLTSFAGKDVINSGAMKSIGNYSDGTFVRTVATNVFKAHNTDTMSIFTTTNGVDYIKTDIVFTDRAFYKARICEIR